MQPGRRPLLLFALFAVAALVYFFREPRLEETTQSAVAIRPAPPPEPATDEFGIAFERLNRLEHKVRRGETFSDILRLHGVAAPRVHEIVDAAKGHLDVRRIRPGDRIHLYRADSAARHLVYQPNPVDFVVLDLDRRIRVRSDKKEVTRVQRSIRGTIEGSLYGAVTGNGGDPALVDRMANDIYAWTIDFQQLQKGDSFSVIYEEEHVDGTSVGTGEILAARFEHGGVPMYAYRLERDDAVEYFDENGNSLRKALLKSPLRYSVVTSGYTQRRFHPVQKRYKPHLGTDYAAPHGTSILAVGDGVVTEAQFKQNNGNYVKIRHNGTYTTGYLHMSRFEKGIKPGVRVRQGQVIGYVGSTGLATGPHVCYRFWKNGVQVDSRKEVMPPSEPVADTHRAAFAQVIQQYRPHLDGFASPQIADGSGANAESR